MKGSIPSHVERFVVQHISSTEQLEVLLLVASQSERAWTAEAVYESVKTNLGSIASHLEEFRRRGFVAIAPKQPPAYRFAPADPAWAGILQELGQIYRQQMHRVIDVIYSKPSTAVQSFADAFRLRKD